METPTIVYDFDTSGGLMEQIQTLLAPPKSKDGEKRTRKAERDARRSGRSTNHDTCDSCREGGDLLCCDHCPASFHLQCCNPPLSEEMLPPGDWMCISCNVCKKKREQKAEQTNGLLEKPLSKRSSSPAVDLATLGKLHLDSLPPGVRAMAQVSLLECRSCPGMPTSNASSTPMPSEEQDDETEGAGGGQSSEPEGAAPLAPSMPRLLKRPFQLLIAAAMERNPTQFQLPNNLTCPTALPVSSGSSKRRRKEELIGRPFRRPPHEMDPNGLVPLPVKVCFTCSRSCRMAPLIQCDYCPLLFHMDCLDPPLTALPPGSWMCPNHIEHMVLKQGSLALTNRCQLFDQFQDRMSQHAVKVDLLRWVQRQNLPNRRNAAHQHRKKTLKVPDAIKSQYLSPPSMLESAGVRNGELICNGVSDQEHLCSSQHFTSEEEQQEWLRDVIALQCSIMRHISAKQISSSSSLSSDWDLEQKDKANIKPCAVTVAEDHVMTASPNPSSKLCGTLVLNGPTVEHDQEGCSCAMRPCQNCWTLNGPLAEPEHWPAKANGPATTDARRQTELLQHRLKPPPPLPASAPTTFLAVPNHLGRGAVVKTESSNSPLGSCAQKASPTPPSVCSDTRQDLQPIHRGVPLVSLSLSADNHIFTPPRLVRDPGTAKLPPPTTPPPLGFCPKTVSPAISSLFPGLLSPIADLSGCMKAVLEGDVEIELSKLDEELVKLLAWQRIQELFPPKAPSPAVTLKPLSRHEEPPKKDVKPRAVFYPLMGKGGAINMCYRTLYIGSGADMDLCLTNYGHCNYISGKHGCIFYDENTKHYELLNYSEHGTTVDNVLYSCDFSEKASPSPAGSLVSRVQSVICRCKRREQEEGAGAGARLMPAGGVMSCQPQGGPRLSCNCKASSSSLIGGSGAGWEGTALLHHGSYIKLGCMQFVFSIAEFASKQPKVEETITTTTMSIHATTILSQEGQQTNTL